MIPATKLLSVKPDVSVVVGSGENKQEFECYGVLLAYASPVLDAMLSSGMKESVNRRIEFPTKDPEVWNLFLKCIDPSRGDLRKAYKNSKKHKKDKVLNASNVLWLVPLFHELGMDRYLIECDDIISTHWLRFRITMWNREKMSRCIEILSFATKYHLQRTIEDAVDHISSRLEWFYWGLGESNIFDFSAVQELLELLRPLRRLHENNGPHSTLASSMLDRLWILMTSPNADPISIIDSNEMCAHYVHNAIQQQHESMKSMLHQISQKLLGQWGSHVTCVKIKGIKKHEQWFDFPLCDIENIDDACFLGLKGPKFNRTYELSCDGKTVYMHSEERRCSPYRDHHDNECFKETSTTNDRIRFSKADVIVAVGEGTIMKEYKCHAAILSLASSKLDSMIANSSGRLLLRHVKPIHWQMFYEYIDPRGNGGNFNLHLL